MTEVTKNTKVAEIITPILNASIITLIFEHLDSLEDIAKASCMCKLWCWHFWRENEQFKLWRPRILKTIIQDSRRQFSAHFFALSKMSKMKMLSTDIEKTIKTIQSLILDQNENFVRAMWMLEETWKTQLKNETLRDTYKKDIFLNEKFWSGEENGKKAAYEIRKTNGKPEIYCLCGVFENDNMKFGSLYCYDQVMYSGQWVDGNPQGQGTMFHSKTGLKNVEGTFKEGMPHGYAVMFHENRPIFKGQWIDGVVQEGISYFSTGHKRFEGMFQNSKQSDGVLYDMKENIVFKGKFAEFQMKVDECAAQHLCTFQVTGSTFAEQKWFLCKTCFDDTKTKGICMACAQKCHKDHDVIFHESSEFFCDCGDGDGCIATTGCDYNCRCAVVGPPPNNNCDCKEAQIEVIDEESEDDDDVDEDEPNADEIEVFEILSQQVLDQLHQAGFREIEVIIRRIQQNDE